MYNTTTGVEVESLYYPFFCLENVFKLSETQSNMVKNSAILSLNNKRIYPIKESGIFGAQYFFIKKRAVKSQKVTRVIKNASHDDKSHDVSGVLRTLTDKKYNAVLPEKQTPFIKQIHATSNLTTFGGRLGQFVFSTQTK